MSSTVVLTRIFYQFGMGEEDSMLSSAISAASSNTKVCFSLLRPSCSSSKASRSSTPISGIGDDGMFSLSSETYGVENASLEYMGLVGVAGISSERSDAVVDTLVGVQALGGYDFTGVLGKAGSTGCLW